MALVRPVLSPEHSLYIMDPPVQTPEKFKEFESTKEGVQQTTSQAFDVESDASASYMSIHGKDEASRLKALATEVRDQNDLERDIGRQVSGSGGILQVIRSLRYPRQVNYLQSKLMKEIKNA